MTQPDGLVYSYVHRINTMGGDMFSCTTVYATFWCVWGGVCVCVRGCGDVCLCL